MTPPLDAEAQEVSLITEYQAAAAKLRVANRSVSLLIIALVLGFVLVIWTEITDFRDEGIHTFSAKLEEEATAFMPTVTQDTGEMLNRLVPVYIDQISQVVERDQEAYQQVLFDEVTQLSHYAQTDAWPNIERELANLVADQEVALMFQLEGVLDREKILKLSQAYHAALESYLVDVYATEFSEHDAIGEEIVGKLQEIAAKDTTESPADPTFTIGLLVELLGLQIQESSLPNGTSL